MTVGLGVDKVPYPHHDIDAPAGSDAGASPTLTEATPDVETGADQPRSVSPTPWLAPPVSETAPDGPMQELEHDVYNIMFLASPYSWSFHFGLMVFLLQMAIMNLLIQDFLIEAPEGNPTKIPIQVSGQVGIAQYVCTVLAVVIQDDIFSSISNLTLVGYDASLIQRFPSGTRSKWILSNVLRLIEGFGLFTVSFFFIVQAEDVLSIFLNFSAMSHVSEIDNIVFTLALSGYMGENAHKMASHVQEVRLPMRPKRWRPLGWIIFASSIAGGLVGLVVIKERQHAGFYLENDSIRAFTIRFGSEAYVLPPNTQFQFVPNSPRKLSRFDVKNPPILQYEHFSGTYRTYWDGELFRHSERPVYFERDSTRCLTEPTCGRFYYCTGLRAWLFSIPALGNATKQTGVCHWGWLAKSVETKAFKLEDVPETGWKIWKGVVASTSLSIVSNVCTGDTDCSLNGQCISGECVCSRGWRGPQCSIEPFCEFLEVYSYGSTAEQYISYGPFSPIIMNGSHVTSYGLDMYEFHTGPVDGISYVVLYTGRRWYGLAWNLTEIGDLYVDLDDFNKNFHAFWDNIVRNDLEWTSTEATFDAINFGMAISFAPLGQTMAAIPDDALGSVRCMDTMCNRFDICGNLNGCKKFTVADFCHTRQVPLAEGGFNFTDCLGIFTERERVILESYHVCDCSMDFGGEYCQYSPDGDYARRAKQSLKLRWANWSKGGNSSSHFPFQNTYELSFWKNASFLTNGTRSSGETFDEL